MNKPKLYVMVGLSASGKSTIAKELAEKENCKIVSSDEIRGQICPNGVADQSMNDEVFKIFHRRIREYLKAGKNVIADATNIKIKSRAAILRVVKDIDCEKIAYVMTKQYKDCIKDNINREYPVPEEVIWKQMCSYQIPFKEEGWDQIVIHDNDLDDKLSNLELLAVTYDFDQKNPHHNQTLDKHCINAYKLFSYNRHPEIIFPLEYIDGFVMGAKLHDLGKLSTQTFDENGIAHYYNHAEAGSYIVLSQMKKPMHWTDDILLNCCFLINYHMMPFNWNSEKAHNKWKRIFGGFKYKMLLDFHECDKARPNINETNQN